MGAVYTRRVASTLSDAVALLRRGQCLINSRKATTKCNMDAMKSVRVTTPPAQVDD